MARRTREWGRTPRALAGGSACLVLGATLALASGCEVIDPGLNFVVAVEAYDADYFYCRVEPEFLVGKRCGAGSPGDRAGGCHFNSSAVSGMALREHPPIDCAGGDRPVSRAQLGASSAAAANLESASLVMSRDLRTAPIYVRPLGANHPRAIFTADDPVLETLRRWSQK